MWEVMRGQKDIEDSRFRELVNRDEMSWECTRLSRGRKGERSPGGPR